MGDSPNVSLKLSLVVFAPVFDMRPPTHTAAFPDWMDGLLPVPESRLEALFLLVYLDKRRRRLPVPAEWAYPKRPAPPNGDRPAQTPREEEAPRRAGLQHN